MRIARTLFFVCLPFLGMVVAGGVFSLGVVVAVDWWHGQTSSGDRMLIVGGGVLLFSYLGILNSVKEWKIAKSILEEKGKTIWDLGGYSTSEVRAIQREYRQNSSRIEKNQNGK